MIADDELDILYFCDIGMEPFTYFLSFARIGTYPMCGVGTSRDDGCFHH